MRAEAGVDWEQLRTLVRERLGLDYPGQRLPELRRALQHAAAALGPEAGGRWLQCLGHEPWSADLQAQLAGLLTVGETYFWRDPACFAALAGHALPALLQARRQERRLRLWSAGCCTGEEAYSLAILLQEQLPDPAQWQIRILATDIRHDFLERARAGVYGEWSFRGCSAAFRQRHFQREADGRYRIDPRLAAMVEFAPLNLAEPCYPALATGTTAMDLILCRNVLMYFGAEQAQAAGARLQRALRSDGWLLLAPGELLPAQLPELEAVQVEGTVLLRKPAALDVAEAALAAAAPLPSMPLEMSALASVPAPEAPPAPPNRADPHALALTARALADRGQLDDALQWCQRWIDCDRLDPEPHYLQALLLHAQGADEAAHAGLQRVLYLLPGAAMAHFALGNLERARGRGDTARRQFELALQLLAGLADAAPLPLSEGLRAGTLREALRTALDMAPAPERAA